MKTATSNQFKSYLALIICQEGPRSGPKVLVWFQIVLNKRCIGSASITHHPLCFCFWIFKFSMYDPEKTVWFWQALVRIVGRQQTRKMMFSLVEAKIGRRATRLGHFLPMAGWRVDPFSRAATESRIGLRPSSDFSGLGAGKGMPQGKKTFSGLGFAKRLSLIQCYGPSGTHHFLLVPTASRSSHLSCLVTASVPTPCRSYYDVSLFYVSMNPRNCSFK